ncbi:MULTISPECIES: DUF4238 domain-containing protein [Pseudomonas]|uniref:DUF4238 domain-containing protein n=1 Tax=Pseudomonas TaxID=286 RepID=UPI0016464BAE|nr:MULTISPECIES: DUF4238 domain-containing protein [Pseudomonas]MBC3233852.1 DUF4238 domain-containing protein [Pseudomonas lurida]MBC3337510.1 DUF4238 domain-containing protein [Pseudomonas proteolytica]
MKQIHKDNHYVPKLYLKQWATAGKIHTYRLLVPNEKLPLWKKHFLKGIAYQEHLYNYFAGGEQTDEIERWLDREFEAPAEEVISRVIRDERLSPCQWRTLIRFAMAQDVRTPARYREFVARQSQSLQQLFSETLERSVADLELAISEGRSLPQPPDIESESFPMNLMVDRQADGSGMLQAQTILGRRLWLWNVRRLLTDTIKKIPMEGWTILKPPPGLNWPTSDNPLVRLNFHGPDRYNFGGGWKVQNGDILLPLSPKHLLYTCVGNRPRLRGTRVDHQTAQFMRRIIIEHADRYVFSAEPSDEHLVRSRVVCPERFMAEQNVWKDWDREQSAAEATLTR